MPICFYIVSGSFHSIRLGVSSCIRDHMATQAKLFGTWSFPINVCQFLFYHTCSTTSFSTLSEAEIKTVNSSSIQLFTYKYHLYFYYPTLEDRYTHTYAPNRGTDTSFFSNTTLLLESIFRNF